MRLFVGNIPLECQESDLRCWFEQQGHTVFKIDMVRDRATGRFRGFAFVELDEQRFAEGNRRIKTAKPLTAAQGSGETT